MFFILSKTLYYLSMPVVLVCLFLLLSALIKHAVWKRRFFWTGFGLLLFFSNGFIANEVMRMWEPDTVAFKDIQKRYEWGILLTGVTMSEMQPNDRTYFHRGADRVTHTLQLYKLGIIKKILVTGGSGRLVDIGEKEAEQIKQVLLLMGVPEEDILTETSSRNTHESAVEVKKILAAKAIHPDDCILITSAFHMHRSYGCFKKQGLVMDTFTTDFYTHPTRFTPDVLLVPKAEALMNWNKIIREWVGIVAYKVMGYI